MTDIGGGVGQIVPALGREELPRVNMSDDSLISVCVTEVSTPQGSRSAAVHACMRFFAVLLTMSVGLGCGATNSRNARSPDGENEEETTEQESEDSEQRAEPSGDSDDADSEGGSRPAKRRKPKRRRHVERAPEPEPPPMYRKPLPPPPVEPLPEEPAPASALTDNTDQRDTALEAEARRRCHWKNVPPYRPDWANSISPPLAQQRKITSKPICPYGTPPAVLRVARQIAVQQTKLKQR